MFRQIDCHLQEVYIRELHVLSASKCILYLPVLTNCLVHLLADLELLYTFVTECTYEFFVVLRLNSDYFPEQN
jgi:hypothetical protein